MWLVGPVECQLVHEVTDTSFQLVPLAKDLFQFRDGEAWSVRVVDVDDKLIRAIRSFTLLREQCNG